jgi:hypothetical protein
VETNGFIVNYDQKSKRIYGQGDDLYVEYGWRKVETKDDGFVAIDDINFDNPFEEGE